MDDIARDPFASAAEQPLARVRPKGPVEELGVTEQAADEWSDAGGVAPSSRLPRVLPLAEAGEMSDAAVPDDALPDDPRPQQAGPGEAAAGSGGDDGAEDEVPTPELGAAPAADVEDGAADEAAAAAPVTDPAQLARVTLGLLLGHREGMTLLRLAQVCETTQEAVSGALERIRRQLADAGLPLELAQHGDTVRLWTMPDVYPYLERLKGIKSAEKLSPAALETLAVIAYRQPVFRAEIEAIRGVKAGPILRTLLEHKLIKVVGRADVPGRPLQYGTTQQFLERFGLASIDDLPSVKEFKAL